MDITTIAYFALSALAAIFAFLWHAKRSQLTSELSRIAILKEEVRDWKEKSETASKDAEIGFARAEEREKALSAQIQSLNEIREALQKEFELLASEALRKNNTSFLDLAAETFKTQKKVLESDGDKRAQAFKDLVQPIETTLKSYDERLKEFDKERTASSIELKSLMSQVQVGQKEVQTEAARLTNALRAAPKTRGRWGEETLKNVMELAGMSGFADFVTEESFERSGSLLRPDVILRLPGERTLVVDAKTSMTAYLDAIEETDESIREEHLSRHAKQIRTHMIQLAKKDYWDELKLKSGQTITPDFVVMFIPGENFFAAAAERDKELFQDAYDNNVVIVTPATFIALAKAIAFGWRQEKVAENARHVAELGRELYKRLSTMGGHVLSLGKSLGKSVENYNGFVSSLDNRVWPQAKRFEELEIAKPGDKLPELNRLDIEVRERPEGRNIELEEDGDNVEDNPDNSTTEA